MQQAGQNKLSRCLDIVPSPAHHDNGSGVPSVSTKVVRGMLDENTLILYRFPKLK